MTDPAAIPSDDLRCIRCGYLLRGLPAEGSCPECSTPIAFSIKTSDLVTEDPLYVGRLALGAGIEICAGVLIILGHLLFLWGQRVESPTVWVIHLEVWRPIHFLSLIGSWLISSRSTHPVPASMNRLRIGVRIVAVLAYLAIGTTLLTHVLGLVQQPLRINGQQWYVWLRLIANCGLMAVFYLYLRQLARRLTDPFLERHAILLLVSGVFTASLQAAPDLTVFGVTSREQLVKLASLLVAAQSFYYVVVMAHARGAFAAAAAVARDRWRPQPAVATTQ